MNGGQGGVGIAVPAAGSGRRMGGVRKPLLALAGEPILVHALRPFLSLPEVEAVVVAMSPEDAASPPPWLLELDRRIQVVPGGSTRLESVGRALDALPDHLSVLAVHDAARPLISREVIGECVRLARTGVGAVAGWPVVDTLKEVDAGGRGISTPDRNRFWRAQTPQVFPAPILRAAYRRALAEGHEATDDAALVSWAGGDVRMVRADPWNLKVTHPEDLALAGTLLTERSDGLGPARVPGISRHLRVPQDSDPDEEILSAVVRHLEADGLLVHPTETVYGIGGRVTEGVLERIREVKGRGSHRPFLLLIPDESPPGLRWTPEARALARRFWPGPLTLVLDDPTAVFPEGIRSPAGGVAVRISPHPFIRALARRWPHPLISTIANPTGGPDPLDMAQLRAGLGDFLVDPDVLVVDGGSLPPSHPSTVVDCTRPIPRIVRSGPVGPDELRDALQGLSSPE